MTFEQQLAKRFKFMRDVECGVDVPRGWEGIVTALCLVLQGLRLKYGDVAQVKEKFGGLRFYHDVFDEDVEAAVRLTETCSYATCLNCGKSGRHIDGWYIRPECPECWYRRTATDPLYIDEDPENEDPEQEP